MEVSETKISFHKLWATLFCGLLSFCSRRPTTSKQAINPNRSKSIQLKPRNEHCSKQNEKAVANASSISSSHK